MSAQNGQLMLKSDKLEFERGAVAKTQNQDRQNGKENRHHDRDGTAGSRKSPASLTPVEILSKDSGTENRRHDCDGKAGSRNSPASLSPVEILSKDSIF